MTLRFPKKPEIRLDNAPLDEVICQIKFPPLLRIANDEAAAFQEEVRTRFPILQLEQGILIQIPGIGSQSSPTSEPQAKIYRFRTPDEATAISLASDFFALSTNKYTHWEDFAKYLDLANNAIRKTYKPSYATRIGVRYINRFTLQNTGSQDITGLLEFFNHDLTSYTRINVWDSPMEMQYQLLLPNDGGRLILRVTQGHDKNAAAFMLLDLDYFEEGQLSLEDLVKRCNSYHDIIYSAFRWCVIDEKMSVFNPI